MARDRICLISRAMDARSFEVDPCRILDHISFLMAVHLDCKPAIDFAILLRKKSDFAIGIDRGTMKIGLCSECRAEASESV